MGKNLMKRTETLYVNELVDTQAKETFKAQDIVENLPQSYDSKNKMFFDKNDTNLYQWDSVTEGFDLKGRSFTELSAAASQYYELSSTITLAGDYSVTALVYFTGSVSALPIYGNTDNANSRTAITLDGGINWRASATSSALLATPGSVPVNKFSVVTVSRTGSTGTITVNGSVVATGTVPTSVHIINASGRTGASTYFEGIIANLVINSAGTKVVNLPFNTNLTSSVIPNSAATLGSELYSSSTVAGGEYAENGAGRKIITRIPDGSTPTNFRLVSTQNGNRISSASVKRFLETA